ncbi:Gfo/Idh/MocA family oxidoreductase [Cytophagaceae bacterium ABcell3]|nr:Gfo/Idh/MocA family oxidoreductase [Cytophagaceae bacterium ABcell3]
MKKIKLSGSRRNFLKNFSAGLATMALAPGASMVQSCTSKAQEDLPEDRQVGIALCGLGWYSTDQLGPALLETKYCRLAGVITGTPESDDRFLKKYQFPEENIFSYEEFDRLADNEDIDVVYLALPPALHPEFAKKAFQAGKHVIVEKPMAPTVEEAKEMLEARDEAGKMMSVGYRVHFDPYHQEVKRLGQEEVYGSVEKAENTFAMYWDRGGWRTDRDLGGGSVYDLGTYVIQAAIYSTGEVPVAVRAEAQEKQRPDKFEGVDESMKFTLEFPSGAEAECETNFWKDEDILKVETAEGYFEIEPAFDYYGQRGETHEGVIHFGQVNQQARQMDDFAQRIITGDQNTPVPGEMGLRDVRIIEAVYRSAETGERVEIDYTDDEKIVS